MTTQPPVPATPPAPPAKESVGKKIISFFEHIGSWLTEHLGSAASFEQMAATTLTILAPLLENLLGLVAGTAIEGKVKAVVAQVTNDLTNTSALLNGAEAGSAHHSVAGFLTDAQNAIGTLLADADVKNSAKVSEITSIANTILGEIQAIIAAIPEDHSVPLVGTATAS